MTKKPKKPKIRIPLPKKTEKTIPDKTKYSRKGRRKDISGDNSR